jgi:hypothetical protein
VNAQFHIPGSFTFGGPVEYENGQSSEKIKTVWKREKHSKLKRREGKLHLMVSNRIIY